MPFSTGQTPPRVGTEAALDEVEVGVVIFEDPVAMADEDAESPVGTPEETPDVDKVEFADTIFGGPLGGLNGGGVNVDDVELDDPPRIPVELIETAAEPDETVTVEVVGEPETVLRTVDKFMVMLLGGD